MTTDSAWWRPSPELIQRQFGAMIGAMQEVADHSPGKAGGALHNGREGVRRASGCAGMEHGRSLREDMTTQEQAAATN